MQFTAVESIRWNLFLLPRATATLAQLASPLPCANLLGPFGAKSTGRRIKGGRRLCCLLVRSGASNRIESANTLACDKRLDAVNAPCKLLPEPEWLDFRRRESLPIWHGFRHWIDSNAMKGGLPKSRLGKALMDVNNHWDALRRCWDDGRLPIDNHVSAQTIRPFILEIGTAYSWNIRKRLRAP
jgi:hypothetical protein